MSRGNDIEYKCVAVLGKRIIEGKISEEYASRIKRLEEHLQVLNPDLVIFSGGKNGDNAHSEAEAGYRHFTLLNPGFPAEKVYCEEESKNSKENFKNILSYLSNLPAVRKGNFGLENIELDVVSQDYHIRRIKKVEKFFPKVSLLNPLKRKKLRYRFLEVPCPYIDSKNETEKWQAGLYFEFDDMTLTEVNLEGIMQEKESRLKGAVIKNLEGNLSVITGLLRKSPKGQKAKKIFDKVSETMPVLLYFASKFTELKNKNLTRSEKYFLSCLYPDFKDRIKTLGLITDPDKAAIVPGRH